MTGNAHIVPVMIKLEDIYEPISRARNITAQIIYNVDQIEDNFVTKLIKENIFEFDKKFHEMHYQMNDYLTHIIGFNLNNPTHSRRIRGAVNFIGSLANTLFGTATQGQIDFIHDHLHSLDTFTEQERRLLNVHSSILNVTLKDLTNVHHALDKLEKASRLTEKILNDMSHDIHLAEQTLLALETLLHLQLALSTISADHVNLRVGLQTMLETYISPNIITNAVLLTLLDELSAKTPGLLFPPKPEFLGLHRNSIRVIHKMDKKLTVLQGLCFYLLIPLRGNPSDTFNVFGMASLPYPVTNTDAFILHKPSKNYLVISESRTSYFLANDFDLCRKFETLLICPPLGPIYHTDTNCCELDIFLERKSASTSCQKLIIKTFPPVFIKTDKGWTYSTSTPIDVTLNCVNNLHKPRHTLQGIGNIAIDTGCSLHSNTFSLPAYSTQNHVEPLSIKPYPFSTPISLSTWEHEFLKNVTNISLPTSMPLEPIPLPDYIDSLQPMLQRTTPQEQPLPGWLTMVVPIIVILLLLGVILGYRRFRAWLSARNGPNDVPHPEDPDAVPLSSQVPCTHH